MSLSLPTAAAALCATVLAAVLAAEPALPTAALVMSPNAYWSLPVKPDTAVTTAVLIELQVIGFA